MSIRIGIGKILIGAGTAIDWAAYWLARLDAWWKEISGTDFTETKINAPVRIKPSAALTNGTDDFLTITATTLEANNSLWFRGCFTDTAGTNAPIIGNTSNLKYFQFGTGGAGSVAGNFMGETDTNSDFINLTSLYTLEANVVYDIVLLNKGEGVWELWIDGVFQSTDTTTQSIITFIYLFVRAATFGKINAVFLGVYTRLLTENEMLAKQIIHSDLKIGYYFTGRGKYEYDISGNGNNAVWSGTGSHYQNIYRGTDYYLLNGWRKFTKDGEKDEIVPTTADTTVIEAAGYVLAETHAGGQYYNKYPATVVFKDVINASSLVAPTAGTATEGTAGAGTISLLLFDRRNRIRQNGKVKYVTFYYKDNTPANTTTVKIQTWRKSGATYDKLNEVDVTASTKGTGDGVKTIKFTPELTVQEGDIWGFEIVNSGANLVLYGISTSANANSLITYADAADATAFDWESKTAVARRITINTFMVAPQVVGLGDSNMAGWSTHRSFMDSTSSIIDNIPASILYQLQLLDPRLTYQNAGVGGDVITQMLTRMRFTALAARPRIMLIHGGVNDIAGAVANATIVAGTMQMVRRAISDGITPVVLHITPWTAGTNANLQDRDLIKVAVGAACDALGVLHVDSESVLGQFREGGDEGNLWDQIPAIKEADGHFKPAGYVLWAAHVYAAMQTAGLIAALEDYDVSKFDLLDRSNATIHAAASRSATDYNPLQPYEYDLANLLDYATYNGFFEAGYADRLFVKVEGDEAKEILNVSEQLPPLALANLKTYCGI